MADLALLEKRILLGPHSRHLAQDDHDLVLDIEVLVVVVLLAGDAKAREDQAAADFALCRSDRRPREPLLNAGSIFFLRVP